MKHLSLTLAQLLILSGSAIAAEYRYFVEMEIAAPAIMFRTATEAIDAFELLRAGSLEPAMKLASCTLPSGSEVKVEDPTRPPLLKVFVLTGTSAGCRGWILRSNVVRSNVNGGKKTRLQ